MSYRIWNHRWEATPELIYAQTVADVVRTVKQARRAGMRVRTVGAGHSFNDISLNGEILLNIDALNHVLAVDTRSKVARVQGGTKLKELVRHLEKLGLALPNIGAWMEQTVAGVFSTGTHGSAGRCKESLLHAFEAVCVVDGSGNLRELSQEELGALSLGFFGVVVEVKLKCVPLYYLRQQREPLDGVRAIQAIGQALAQNSFVDLRWVGSNPSVTLRRWNQVDEEPLLRDRLRRKLEGVQLALFNYFLSKLRLSSWRRLDVLALFDLLSLLYAGTSRFIASYVAVWHEALTFNSLGIAAPHDELEFAISRERTEACLLELRRIMLADDTSSTLEIQVRFSAGEQVLMAPNYGRETTWFNINALAPDFSKPLVKQLTDTIYKHGGRHHWAKSIPDQPPELSSLYGDQPQRWEQIRLNLDRHGVFLNRWYERHLAPGIRSASERRLHPVHGSWENDAQPSRAWERAGAPRPVLAFLASWLVLRPFAALRSLLRRRACTRNLAAEADVAASMTALPPSSPAPDVSSTPAGGPTAHDERPVRAAARRPRKIERR